ncbi:hypothetical protein Dimus_021947 [Dionaea muscipula]
METIAAFRFFLQSVRNQCKKGFRNLEQPCNLFRELTTGGFPLPSIDDFNHLLAAIAKMKEYFMVVKLSRYLEISLGVRPNHCSLSILVNCYSHLDCLDLGLSLMGKMMKLGWEPDGVTYNTLLNGLIANGRWRQMAELVDKIMVDGFSPDLVTYGTLVKWLCRRGEVADVIYLIPKMDGRLDVVIYSMILDGLCKKNLMPEALGLSLAMIDRGILPRIDICTSLVRCLCKLGRWKDGKLLLNKISTSYAAPNIKGFSMLVDWFFKERMIEQAEYVVELMRDRGNGCQPDLVSYNILINGYCKIQKIDKALNLFQEICRRGLTPNTVTYSILLDGLFKANRPQRAKVLLKDMLAHGQSPDVVTLATLLEGLCNRGQLSDAFFVLTKLEKRGFPLNIVVYNVIINVLWSGGRIKEVRERFAELFAKNISPTGHTYTIMVDGLCKHDLHGDAIDLLEDMVESGCTSNGAPYWVLAHHVHEKCKRGLTIGALDAAKLHSLLVHV